MYLKIVAAAIGIFLLSCVTLPIAIGDIATKARVTTFLEANSESTLVADMHPKALDRLVETVHNGSS